jgi:hypothetical protein
MAVVGLAVATLAMGACRADKEPLGPTATVPQETTTTNPYAIPPVIDEAYVNRVLAGLDHAVGDAVRRVVRTKLIDEDIFNRFKAAYAGDAYQLQLNLVQRDLLTGFKGYKDVPGDQKTTVARLITVRQSCIFAEVLKDFSSIAVTPSGVLSTEWIALVPVGATTEAGNYNPTPWMFAYDGFRQDRSQPPDPCASAT